MGILVFIIGACLGSFYLVLGMRLPVGENVINSRSKCDVCKNDLKWWQLIPIVSFIILRGKCHYCKTKISFLNPLYELANGFLFLFAYYKFGFGYEMYMLLIVSSLMLIIFASDFTFMIINDSPLIISIILAFVLRWIYNGIADALLAFLAGIILFCAMYLVKVIGDKLFKRESLGGGDIKFSFVIGIIAGYKLGLCVLILSCFLALPYCVASIMLKKNNEVPYGPFLAASLFVVCAFTIKFNILLDLIFSKL